MAFLDIHLHSETLGKATEVYAVIPQRSTQGLIGMDAPPATDKYRCLYLLHGFSDDASIWMRRTSIERYANRHGIAVVMPDAGKSFYSNMVYGDRYYDYIARELPRLMEDMFPISPKPEDRFIAGLSMGGYGALKIGLREEGRFAAAAGLSPCGDIRRMIAEGWTDVFRPIFGDNPVVPDEDDLLFLAKNCKARPRVRMVIGTEDFLYKNVQPLRALFEEEKYDFTYHDCPGTHNWDFWDEHIVGVLDWMFGNAAK